MTDLVNHPSHYADGWSNGAEVIDITENLNFNRGNAVKYIARAGKKDPAKELEDLQKAEFYLKREIARLGVETPIPAEPRVWKSFDDVPEGVVVSDEDDDHWKLIGGVWHIKYLGTSPEMVIQEFRTDYEPENAPGPFTEVLGE